MPKYKLTYFDARAIGEPIRMILSYMGESFEDVRIPFDEWLKIKPSAPPTSTAGTIDSLLCGVPKCRHRLTHGLIIIKEIQSLGMDPEGDLCHHIGAQLQDSSFNQRFSVRDGGGISTNYKRKDPGVRCMKFKAATLFGKLPLLEVDGKIVCQSSAICRYLARDAGLAGSNNWEDLQIDSVVDTVTDYRLKISGFHHEKNPEVKEKLRQEIINDIGPYYLKKFDELVKSNNGYLANGKLSWADLYLIGYSDTHTALIKEDLFQNYPNLSAWIKKIKEIPQIKQWLEKRPLCAI